jgi:preprotein translocase subunit SecF
MMKIIQHKFIFLTFSAILVLVSIYGLIAFGFQRGIDFTGGSLWQIQFISNQVSKEELSEFLKVELGLQEAIITSQDTGSFIIKTKEITEAAHQDFSNQITAELGDFDELSFQSIGASIGRELSQKALWAFVINLIAISLYIAYAFRRVSFPVKSWKYAAITLITLFHDAIIPIGLFAFLGKFAGVEIDTNFIVAILVVVGFSVHDTIVVFDRIRENLGSANLSGLNFSELVNTSVNETIARSINTSLTLIVVLLALYILGAASLSYFILAILVGTIAGTYSSIFVASPLLTIFYKPSK